MVSISMTFSKRYKMIWNDLSTLIEANQKFIISSHMSLDGDSVGSQLSFFWYLTSLGKEVQFFTHDVVPAKFRFLKNSHLIPTEKPVTPVDVLVILDSSNPGRLGIPNYESIAKSIINIDHHRDNTKFGEINVVETEAAATGELIYKFLIHCGCDFPPYVAEALYTAIMSDTGGFRFANTNSKVLRICADLVDRGADCARIYQRVYSSHSDHALLLQSRIWSSLKFYLDGRVCTMEMSLTDLDELGAEYSDSEGMVDYTTTAEGVKVGLLAKYSDKETHFSLRSKGSVDVGKIAQKVPGGGGHLSAAGCTVQLPFEQALPFILQIIEKELG